MTSPVRSKIATAVANLVKKEQDYQQELEASSMMLKLVAQVMEKERRHDKVKELEEATLEMIRFAHDIQNHTKALQKLPEIYVFQPEADPTNFEDMIAAEFAGIATKNPAVPEEHESYRVFQEAVWNVHNAGKMMPGQENEEMVMTAAGGTLNLHCPLTLRPVTDLEDPACSNECRHVYDRKSMLEHIGGRQKQCPIAGCPKKIKPSSLVCDAKLKMELREMRERAASVSQARTENYTELD